MDSQRRAGQGQRDANRKFMRANAVQRTLDDSALLFATDQQQVHGSLCQTGRRQADALWPGAGAGAIAGVHRDISGRAGERLIETAHIRKQRGRVAIRAHAKQGDAGG